MASQALSIVVPVYNEDKNIEATLRALKNNVPVEHEVLVAYDSDTDTTLEAVRRLAGEFPNVRLIKNTVHPGPSGALRTAFAQAKHPLVMVMMADLCDDFTQIPKLLELVPASADIACPSRYCPGGEQRLESSFLKIWSPRVAGFLLKYVAGLPTYDPTNSFKLYSGEMLRSLSLTSTSSFSVTLEIVAKAHCLGYRLVELPTVWLDRQNGQSNFKLGRSLLTYLPWFFLALVGNPALRLPRAPFNYLCRKPLS